MVSLWGLVARDKIPAIIPDSLNAEIGSKQMRSNINKIIKGYSTKSERRFCELLKKLHIPFRYKVKIQDREVDFLIGNTVIELDGHPQDSSKNWMLIKEGYNPIHFNSWEIPNDNLVKWLKNNGWNKLAWSSSNNSKS